MTLAAFDTGRTIGAAPSTALPAHPDIARGRQRLLSVYDRVCFLAALGEPMESNTVIGARCGAGLRKITATLGRMQEEGLIRIEYSPTGHTRRVTVLATGQSTGWQKPWRKYPEGREPPATKRHRAKGKKARARPKVEKPTKPKPTVPRISKLQPLMASRGISDVAIYGHLADAVRACRRAGDVVYRNPKRPLEILINGKPKDVKERAAWHAAHTGNP